MKKNNKYGKKVKKNSKFMLFLKEIYTQSFTKYGKIHPPYIYIWMLLLFVLLINILKVFVFKNITDEYALGLCGFVVLWIAIFQYGETKK